MSSQILGNTNITHYDVLIIGTGAGGSAAAEILCANNRKVLMLEAGSNYFNGIDQPDDKKISTTFSNDELKMKRRNFIHPDPLTEPRSFRHDESKTRTFVGEVNQLPKTLGGGAAHADLKIPRFEQHDFKMRSLMGEVSGTTFADWPIDYWQLEKFYCRMERVLGAQGPASLPMDTPRSEPYPMPPGHPMLCGLLVKNSCEKLGYQAFAYPTAVNSRPYDNRPACNDCGFCSGYVCTTGAKGTPPMTTLRKSLLSGNCTILAETRATKLRYSENKITGVEAIGPQGEKLFFQADRYVVAASPIESARLLQLSGNIGNSSGMVGRNLMFHYQTFAVGIFDQRLHSYRGRTVTHGMMDFRGNPRDRSRPMGGIVEIAGSSDPIDEAVNYRMRVNLTSKMMNSFMKQSPLRDRIIALIMQAEDAPQFSNRVDLDPDVKDLDGLPVSRVTFKNHNFELNARKFYLPQLLDVLGAAGAKYGFIAPADEISISSHVMGTLRFGNDPKSSVCNAEGKFHDFENLYASDGSLFPTSSGLNPTLTIMALGSWVGANIASPGNPEGALGI